MLKLSSRTAYSGEVEMLPKYADLDDLGAVNNLLQTLNNLEMPEKYFWSHVIKIRDIKTKEVSVNYYHTSLNF